ncbi:hypothetical protein P691DRAFT_270992 [Macrolepiota fuliginosa MF-IS2]|uniref:F-box domain-containing protein n=1 Tax=Macrolepiota fuliginosa MF-IS2 TaxID=1400762 RepID=A0A9P5X5W1_9AGAR|nr:hypothetical protein P691DRAFT_270992 [Macrolepiota fuliginosa MF-IS2]
MFPKSSAATVVKVTLSDLPPEILTHILFYLPFTSVVVCGGINQRLQAFVSGSTELQYRIHLGMSGLIDNPFCILPISKRLSRLLAKEHRWEHLNFDFDKRIDVPFQFRSYDTKLTPGVFSGISVNEESESHYIQIPSALDQEVKWQRVRSEDMIISPGACVYEHDLHILITVQTRTNYTTTAKPRNTQQLQVHINQLSTGEPHPDAQLVTISLDAHGTFEQPLITAECTGDNLVLVLCDNATGPKPQDMLYVYDWKTGERKLRHGVPFHSYRFPIFLTTHIFLLPNSQTGELEYWRIPHSPAELMPDQPFLVLSLPRLRSRNTFPFINCRVEPNPRSRPHDASKPFYADPHHAIVIFMVYVRLAGLTSTYFTFFIHRSSLVECIDKFSAFTSFDDRPKPVPYDEWGPPVCRWFAVDDLMWLAATFDQTYIASPPKGETGDMPLTLLDFNPIAVARALAAERYRIRTKSLDGDGRSFPQGEGSSRDKEEMGPGPKRKDVQVPLQMHEGGTPTTSSDSLTKQVKARDPSRESSLRERVAARAVTRAMDPLNDQKRCFENTVYSSLPYTVRSSQDKYNFDALLLDEESIIGIRMAGRNQIKELHILHYG